MEIEPFGNLDRLLGLLSETDLLPLTVIEKSVDICRDAIDADSME